MTEAHSGSPVGDHAVEGLLARALELEEEGDWEGAAALLREGVEEYPEESSLFCWLGVAERELGEEGLAYERFRQCLALEPVDPLVLATAGNAVAAFDDPGAEAALRTAALTAPTLALARWMYGAYLAREGLLQEALDELEAASRLEPEDPVIAVERGVALALSDRLPEAAHAFGLGVELDPEDGWSRILFGLAQVLLDEWEQGAQELDAGARMRPEDVEAQLLAALASGAVEEDGLALEMLERARLRARGQDLGLVLEVEERLEDGPEAARELLHSTLAPVAFRERIMVRP